MCVSVCVLVHVLHVFVYVLCLCMFSVCLCVYGGGGVWVMEKNRRKFPNSFLLLTPAKDD